MPVAALPLHPGESYFVVRGKVRPALVLGKSEPIAREARRGQAAHQSAQCLLIAPFYGAEQDGSRGGWSEAFKTRIRRAEYPQYVWDSLPIPGKPKESILRLDHLMPIGADPASYERFPFRLSQDGLGIIHDWLSWLQTGVLSKSTVLSDIRAGLAPSSLP